MRDAAPQTIYLKDYAPFGYLIDEVVLDFNLHPTKTRVTSRIQFRPNPETTDRQFFLHGEKLNLIKASVDGSEVSPSLTDEGLTLDAPDAPFLWEAEVEISPETNTALEGLYMSNGMYCTQCEAEGFRKITYYPDRPDVMAVFTVRIHSDLPVLLSNGNPADGSAPVAWHDPHPKPAYLFALVAGDLVNHAGQFTTASGRDVALNIWVRPGDEHKCDYALDALIRSMRWDEEVYGREYDLDIFNIVAVDDFNMGAMENKGLNIFNSKYVLASPETATDRDYDFIEGIVAHEYFHNWTGNRITCRDWFQLCLKEGLTVFRDQQFSGDMRGHAVKRIEEVLQLRARQFREDNGPLAHPVRPESFVEINNFYTATVYEKGAEVIGMLRSLVGPEGYAKALDLYFDRHDGDAATIEDWLKVFEDATGRNLSQFALWYSQAGTPRLSVKDSFEDGVYTLDFQQINPATPGQDKKEPQVIPIAVGLLDQSGKEVLPTQICEMTEARQMFRFKLDDPPVPSILRHFSAPVILDRDVTPEERAFLLAHDTDPFNKFEAGRQLAKHVLTDMVTSGTKADPAYLDAMDAVLRDDGLDPAFRALALGLPSEDDIAQALYDGGATPDPTAIYDARDGLAMAMAERSSEVLASIYDAMEVAGPYSPDADAAGKRALHGGALALLTRIDGGARAEAQFASADNMTESLSALGAMVKSGRGANALAAFRDRWAGDRLVMDKWFALQVSLAEPAKAASTAKTLTELNDFDWKNPNRFRSVIGGLAMNTAGFHDPSGASYHFVADWLIKLDPLNPQTTARMCTVFETWGRYDGDRQGMMKDALNRIAATPNLSRDATEMVGRILNG
jgi:aminopeptidase N